MVSAAVAARALYGAAAVTTSVTAATGPRRLHAVTKMLLAPALQTELVAIPDGGSVRPALLVATTGSWVGDWFMYREGDAVTPEQARREMRRGASAFAVQQVVLLALMARRGDRPRRGAVVPAAAVLAGLAALESARTRRPADPLLSAYGLTLGAMAAVARSDPDPRVRAGGDLFLASDAVIIVRQHLLRGRRVRAVAELAVMGSYAAALALLVRGLAADPAPDGP